MRRKYSYLVKNTGLFALSGFVPRVLSFLLVPLYTSILTVDDYGISDLIVTTTQLLLPILTCDIQDAVMRFAMDREYDRKQTFTIALQVIAVGTSVMSLGCLVVAIMRVPGIDWVWLVFLVLMFVGTAFTNSISMFCRAIDKVRTVAVGSILNSVVTLILNITFLLLFRWGLVGYLAANMAGNFLALGYYVIDAKLWKFVIRKIDNSMRKEMLVFSFPLVFSVIAWWINNASDRYILAAISGVAVSGVYAIAYKIPTILSVFQNVFFQAWSISAIKEFDSSDGDGFIGSIYTFIAFGMTVACSAVMLINVPIASLLYSKDFNEAWVYVPPLLVSVIFNAMSLFVGSIFTAAKATKTLSCSTIIGAVANIVLNLSLIPQYGAYGAALATLASYGVVFAIRRWFLRQYVHMRTSGNKDIAGYAIVIAQMALAYFGNTYILIQANLLVVILILYRKEFTNMVIKIF